MTSVNPCSNGTGVPARNPLDPWLGKGMEPMPAYVFPCRSLFKLAALLFLVPWAAHGQAAPAFEEEVGYLLPGRVITCVTCESLVSNSCQMGTPRF